MKKFFTLFSAAMLVFAACDKVEPLENNVVTTDGKVVLKATMPTFHATKASVSETGVFGWEVNDIIDVVYTNGGSTTAIQFQCTNVDGTFENVSSIPDGYSLATEGVIAYYPTGYNGTASNQDFSSLDAAQKGFQMHATYDNGNLKFVHDNAIFKITISNVPSFATLLTVGGATISLHGSSDNVTAWIPAAPAESAKLAISLKDDASNTIISKSSKNSVAIAAANLYLLNELKVNRFVVVNNSSNNTHRLGLGIRALDGSWVDGSWATFDFNVTSTGIKYFVLTDTYANAKALQVELRQNDGSGEYAKSTAEYMIPVRNFVFDATDNSLKTTYRAYASFTDTQWGYWITQGSGTTKVMFRRAYDKQPSPSANDTECTEVTVNSGKLFYYEFPVDEYGYNNLYWGFYNDQDTGWKGEWDNATINRDFIKIM